MASRNTCSVVHGSSHLSTHLILATCFVGLGISVVFLHRTWHEWLSSSQLRNARQFIPTGRADGYTAPKHAGKSHASSATDSIQQPPAPVILKSAETSAATTASHASLVDASVPLVRLPRPFGFRSFLGRLAVRPLATLLLLTWITYTVDQILMTVVAILLLWVCPQFNCVPSMLHVTEDCPAATLFTIMVYAQTVGACAFVLSTVVRFIYLFSILSRPRFLALRVGCGLVIAATLVRLVALVIRWALFTRPESAMASWLDVPWMYSLTEFTYVAFYGVIGLACLTSLALGVQYVFQVRRSVRDAGVSSVALTHQLTSTLTASSPVQPHSTMSTAPATAEAQAGHVEGRKLSPCASSPFAFPTGATRLHLLQRRPLSHKERVVLHTRRVLIWITAAMMTLVTFTAIILTPGVAKSLSALFLNSFMTLFLKCFSAFVTLAIGSMTKLVLSHQG